MTPHDDSGIFYFLGNITNHILHALPLYDELGGTFVVTSKKAQRFIEEHYNVPVINIDNKPYKWVRPGRKPKRIHEYIVLDESFKKTYKFLNENAKVVIFYELFDFKRPDWLNKPKKVFLTHGNMLKSYMTMYPKRLEIIKDYDYMAALGPHMKKQFIKDGIDPKKLIDIGIARTDEVLKNSGKTIVAKRLSKALDLDPNKKIISYMPTFWGASSIYTTGLKIIRDFPDEYTLIFRPHPQTSKKILQDYIRLIDSRPNIVYAPEGRHKNVSLVDIFDASSAIIGDVSSVMLEAILTKKPLIFAYDDEEHQQSEYEYRAIKDVVNFSQAIHANDRQSIETKIDTALTRDINLTVWNETIKRNFFNSNRDSAKTIAEFIQSII